MVVARLINDKYLKQKLIGLEVQPLESITNIVCSASLEQVVAEIGQCTNDADIERRTLFVPNSVHPKGPRQWRLETPNSQFAASIYPWRVST